MFLNELLYVYVHLRLLELHAILQLAATTAFCLIGFFFSSWHLCDIGGKRLFVTMPMLFKIRYQIMPFP